MSSYRDILPTWKGLGDALVGAFLIIMAAGVLSLFWQYYKDNYSPSRYRDQIEVKYESINYHRAEIDKLNREIEELRRKDRELRDEQK